MGHRPEFVEFLNTPVSGETSPSLTDSPIDSVSAWKRDENYCHPGLKAMAESKSVVDVLKCVGFSAPLGLGRECQGKGMGPFCASLGSNRRGHGVDSRLGTL